MDHKDLGMSPIEFNKLDRLAWNKAMSLFTCEAETRRFPTIEEAVDAFMSATEEVPDGIAVWEPFEHWELCGLQSLIEDTHDSLLYFIKDALDAMHR